MFENWKFLYNKLVAQEILFAKKKFIEGLDKNIIHNTIWSIFWVKIVKLNDNNSLHRWAIQWKDYHLHEIMWYMMNNWKITIILWSKLKQLPLLR